MNTIRFAIIGCGNIGRRHLAVVDAEARAEIDAVCDIVGARASENAALYGVDRHFTDYAEMLEATDAEVVSICTPHGLHAEMSIAASKAGKHVLVEKPMALSTSECKAMMQAAEENGVSLMVVKQNRYNKPMSIVHKALKEGRLGEIYLVQCHVLWNRHAGYYADSNWRGRKDLEGGVLFTQVVHFIDLLIWWFGDVIDASASISTRKQDIEIEDIGNADLVFSSGVSGSLLWTTCVYNNNFEGSITIIGEEGTIKIGGQFLNRIDYWDVHAYPLPEGVEYTDEPNIYSKYQGTSSNHPKVVEDVVASLLHERHDIVEGNEGIKSIAAIEKIYEAARR
jgi:UDP-N-acetyl-2-amino-2-deoxyglucuronate dehydrogenase